VTPIEFLNLYPFQWLAIITAGTTLLLMVDALVGHYRRAFAYRMQYTPVVSGTALAVAALLAAAFPDLPWLNQSLSWAGWLAAVTGLIGFGYHFYYGIMTKPGGVKWLLHYLMYGAPILAPLGLTAVGVLGVITARGLAGENAVFGLAMPVVLFLFVTIVLAGAIAQAGILHYRGAFNNPAMYAPLTVPSLAMIAGVWMALAPSTAVRAAFAALLWMTLLVGFIGFGMHLRGLDREMGGLYVWLSNLLEGPPQGAPGLFIALAAIGLVGIYLL
jgi:hypothetical protein